MLFWCFNLLVMMVQESSQFCHALFDFLGYRKTFGIHVNCVDFNSLESENVSPTLSILLIKYAG